MKLWVCLCGFINQVPSLKDEGQMRNNRSMKIWGRGLMIPVYNKTFTEKKVIDYLFNT
jgi:hypothetical protein